MYKIDTTTITDWKVVSNTRPIKAKPLVSLIVDKTVVNKFLVDTLEGKEPLGDGVVICVGEAGDTWQQMPKKLLQKYSVIAIDNDGWMVCEPLPDNAVDVMEVTSEFLLRDDNAAISRPWICETNNEFWIKGVWGESIMGETNVQMGNVGDFICRNRTDHSDVWIVRRKLFLNTYVIKS
jgi:hypothetical protein